MVDDCYALSLEYAKISKDVPTSMFPITVAKQPMYKPKNRYNCPKMWTPKVTFQITKSKTFYFLDLLIFCRTTPQE